MRGPLLIAFDGSEGARRAVLVAAELMPGASAVVACAWQPMAALDHHDPVASWFDALSPQAQELDELSREAASRHADEGVALAREAGLDAAPLVLDGGRDVAGALLDAARERSTAVLVMGARGVGRIEAMLLGSTSHAVVARARSPVLVVPPEDAG
jgi:nucleotide-binding universal stress UspA family protein